MSRVERVEGRTVVEQIPCECGRGKMVFNGVVLTSMPPQYENKCSECGARAYMSKAYPAVNIEYKGYEAEDEGSELEGYVGR